MRFDELARQAAWQLLERFWIPRSDRTWYQAVREREHALRSFFMEKLGFRLIVHYEFVKLEKFLSVKPAPWMGITSFTERRDYVLFCLLMAFLEGKTLDEQFLLEEITDELKAMYPPTDGINWTNYEHRKSLVRVLQMAKEWHLLLQIDGDDQRFLATADAEVLYEVTPLARYFLRAYPRDLTQFSCIEELLEASEGEDKTLARRHRVYRQLLLTPGVREDELADGDWSYLRNQRNVIARDFDEALGLTLELYGKDAMLTHPGKSQVATLFPDARAVSDVILFFARTVHEAIEQQLLVPEKDGRIVLTEVDFASLVETCKQRYDYGWSKAWREMSVKQLARHLWEELVSWGMARQGELLNLIELLPRLGRIIGHYPRDFDRERKEGETAADESA
jgi:uncharacterized protein (TIGR02678 family)